MTPEELAKSLASTYYASSLVIKQNAPIVVKIIEKRDQAIRQSERAVMNTGKDLRITWLEGCLKEQGEKAKGLVGALRDIKIMAMKYRSSLQHGVVESDFSRIETEAIEALTKFNTEEK